MVTVISGQRWRLLVLAAVTAAALALVAAAATPAAAAPSDPAGGENKNLQAQLNVANQGFLDAKALLEGSRARQAAMQAKVVDTEAKIAAMADTARTLTAAAWRNNSLRTASALLSSVSPENFIDRANAMSTMASRSQKQLRDYANLRRQLQNEKAAIDAEVAQQELQLAEMEKRKKEAEKALASYGGGQNTSGPPSGKVKFAAPAPRNADGSWPRESCIVDDPTPANGCITPRMLHALTQAQNAGYKRYVSCYRPQQDGGEHPKGQACDFAAFPGGFEDRRAGGADKAYGDELANYFVGNANNLAVKYVIWYNRIWQSATGSWKTYTSGNGTPAGDHYNHVHLSVL